MSKTETDVLIVGGGPVGASLACALSGYGLKITVVEGGSAQKSQSPSYDDRAIALASGSARVFENLGLWQQMQPETAAIRQIHVSDRGNPTMARLRAEQENVPALGYVVPARALGQVLLEQVETLADVNWLAPATLQSLEQIDGGVKARIRQADDELQVQAALMVACDGGQSRVRSELEVAVKRRDYHQSAIIANVTPQYPHQGVAYERFTDSGPLAMLPMSEGRCSLVWTAWSYQLDGLMALDDAAFAKALENRFGLRLGRIRKVGQRACYPLGLLQAEETIRPNVVLIGNAAHTLHPVAGQGFNLGLRDVAVLSDVLLNGLKDGRSIGDFSLLEEYEEWRRSDQNGVALFTDVLARMFANPAEPVRLGRNLGLKMLSAAAPARHLLARHAMGLAGRLPRLARNHNGVSL